MQKQPAGAFRADARFDDPSLLSAALLERVLPLVTRPARYLGGEHGAARPAWRADRANVLLAFPDAYEIGMSHTGLRILYALLNGRGDAFADLAFAPWPDLEELLRAQRLPLFGLQSRRPARAFDLLAFSVGYELGYTNLLTMIDLAGLPLRASQRGQGDPVIVAGGACAVNPLPLSPFVDVFFLGDGEEAVGQMAAAVLAAKGAGEGRAALCARLAALPGAWRPGGPPARPRVAVDLDCWDPPAGPVPAVEPVHDRLNLEIMRGCSRGCRFCLAGMIGRPVRERSPAAIAAAARAGLRRTGWREISLLSLSAADHTALPAVVDAVRRDLDGTRARLALPSLRVDALPPALYAELTGDEPAGFTFAPEAGTQRLRDVINKNVREEDVLASVSRAFAAGAKGVKLYFMLGLPTETDDDLRGLIDLVGRVVKLAPRGGGQVTVSLSPFAPKPHTPFQWAGQPPVDELRRRNTLLEEGLRRWKVKVSLRDPEVSALEAVLGLGDERAGEAVLAAWRRGARFDAWSEWFDAARWREALAEAGVERAAELAPRDPAAPLPWQRCAAVIDPAFLRAEWERALAGEVTADCRLGGDCLECDACGGDVRHRYAPHAGPGGAAVGAAVGAASAGAPPALTPAQAPAAPAAPFDPRNASAEDPGRERRRWTVWRSLSTERCWYRAEHTKLGEARFLGHLDFQRMLQLALQRAGLPIAFSRGFHPHPLLRFGPPLPLGVEGEHEILDLAFARQAPAWQAALNAELPSGVRILRADLVGPLPPRALEAGDFEASYLAQLPPAGAGGPDAAALRARAGEFLAAGSWPHRRQRPQGEVVLDVRSLVPPDGLAVLPQEPAAGAGARLRFTLRRQERQPLLPAPEFLAALCGPLLTEPRLCRVRRTGLAGRAASGRWLAPLAEVGEANRRLWLRTRVCA